MPSFFISASHYLSLQIPPKAVVTSCKIKIQKNTQDYWHSP